MNLSVQSLLATEPNVALVCILGIAVVFLGLIAIIGIVRLMNRLCDIMERAKSITAAPVATSAAPVAPVAPVSAPIPNKQEIVAAVCAAVAEEEGVDVSAIRVLSFKKL